MNRTILTDPFPASGHISAMMTFAKFLTRHEFKPCFSGPADFKNKIREAGFDYYIISPLLLTPESVEINGNGLLKFLMENLAQSRFKRLKTEFEEISRAYDRMIESVQPDLILLDDHYAFKALFYQKYGIPIITVQSMILPIKSRGIPPFQSTYIPGQGRLSEMYIELLWIKRTLTRSIARFRNSLQTLGNTNLRILQKLCPATWLSIDYNRCYGLGISELPMISTSPKPYDFPRMGGNHSWIYYFGNQESLANQKIEDERLLSVLSKTEKQKKDNPDKLLIYCSLGTVMGSRDKTRQKFYTKIISVAGQNSNIEFILSIGKQFDVNTLPRIPDNLHLFSWVPQKQLLKHVDIMITHGGINSVRECIDAEVPTINYPLSVKWDQPGTAARAVFHHLGLMGNIKRATPRSISKQIKTILKERDRFRRSLRDMKRKIEESNRSEEKKILELIGNLTAKSKTDKRQIHEVH